MGGRSITTPPPLGVKPIYNLRCGIKAKLFLKLNTIDISLVVLFID